MRTVVTFSMDTETDRDLLRWLERQGNKSAAIRDALRAQVGRQAITLADVLDAVEALAQRGVMFAGENTPPAGQEPPDVAAALDGLGL